MSGPTLPDPPAARGGVRGRVQALVQRFRRLQESADRHRSARSAPICAPCASPAPRNPAVHMPRAESLFFRSVPDGRDHAAVAADQRARLLDAMTRVVVRKGYARTTVADVVEV